MIGPSLRRGRVRQPTVMSGRRTPATTTTTRRPATSAARTEPGSRPGHPSGVPTALPPSAATARSEPELAARTGLLANVEEDMTEFPGTGGSQAMLLLWVVISAGGLAVALVLNAIGH